jgi:hypothetical protein
MAIRGIELGRSIRDRRPAFTLVVRTPPSARPRRGDLVRAWRKVPCRRKPVGHGELDIRGIGERRERNLARRVVIARRSEHEVAEDVRRPTGQVQLDYLVGALHRSHREGPPPQRKVRPFQYKRTGSPIREPAAFSAARHRAAVGARRRGSRFLPGIATPHASRFSTRRSHRPTT